MKSIIVEFTGLKVKPVSESKVFESIAFFDYLHCLLDQILFDLSSPDFIRGFRLYSDG